MQQAKIILYLSLTGDVPTSTAEKTITPAEMLILKSIHGNNSIRNIRIQENKIDRSMEEEFHRLVNFYGIKKLKVIWPQIDEHNLPFKDDFKDIGVDKKAIKRSLKGIGALEKTEITEDIVEDCVKAKMITKEVILEVLETMTQKDKKVIIAELEKKSTVNVLKDL